jgi:hypothetical protein
MDQLLIKDESRFIIYAMRDALITLEHARHMEKFNFDLKGIGILLTLSGLGNRYLLQ